GIQESAHHYIGARRGDQLLGWLSLVPDDEPLQIAVAMLVVHPDHQRQGIGRSLVLHALRQAAGEVFSVTTAAGNVPALALYRELGFIEYRRGTLGPAALEVVKLRMRSGASAGAADLPGPRP
ncbi:MAG: GNAT family N-acetyltransferase, partial [Pseudomonadota bacterium]|nr:GNAT family N-acetyltransferase [Pseudomonadota bacterium]